MYYEIQATKARLPHLHGIFSNLRCPRSLTAAIIYHTTSKPTLFRVPTSSCFAVTYLNVSYQISSACLVAIICLPWVVWTYQQLDPIVWEHLICQQHHWCSGNINAFQAFAMSSILVWCSVFCRFFFHFEFCVLANTGTILLLSLYFLCTFAAFLLLCPITQGGKVQLTKVTKPYQWQISKGSQQFARLLDCTLLAYLIVQPHTRKWLLCWFQMFKLT